MKLRVPVLIALAIVLLAGEAVAQQFPRRPISYVIPFAAGGESDITARLQQRLLEEILGQRVLVTNKPGGGGALGWSELVTGRPDGYTVTGINLPHTIVGPMQNPDSGYRTEDINPVYYFQNTPNVLFVPRNSQFRTLNDLIEHARRNPGAVTIGGSGSWSANHIGVIQMEKIANVKLTYIPFTGTGTAVPAALGGHVVALMSFTPMAVQYANEFRALAVATERRVEEILPGVPTFRELGFDIVGGSYRGVGVPPNTPPDVIRVLENAFDRVNRNPEFAAKMREMGFVLEFYGAEASRRLIAESTRYHQELLRGLDLR